MEIDDVTAFAGRPAAQLTRRDVARALLAVPAAEATGSLASLRRALTAAGNAFSAVFWQSAESMLARIPEGAATVGDVREWLEATGTEPTMLIGMHVWDDEEERTPLAAELHELLVRHLEERVAAGDVDPDRLAAGDAQARAEYVALQERWLYSPLPDGRVPAHAIDDEEFDALAEGWDAADAEALKDLEAILTDVGERPCPEGALRSVCDRLRTALGSGERPYDLLATAGGVDPVALHSDDTDLWLTLAAGSVAAAHEPPAGYETEALAAWYGLEHVDWLGAVAGLARGGPGTSASADDLAEHVAASEDVEGGFDDPDDAEMVWFGFSTPVVLWRTLGAIDADDALTPLGWWGLPEALRRAWSPSESDGR